MEIYIEMDRHRIIAIYLPQYHPFKENDEWWGAGFTEWTNVSRATPKFHGHYQPHIPADLGFYDLRLPETRIQQAALAARYGIYGFCYYHYWFSGKVLMERPMREMLESNAPRFPFMICWANESWTRAWDGGEREILINQNYSVNDSREHIKWMLPYLKDPRYIRIDNRPVIAIYRTTSIPDLQQMLKIWREEAEKEGVELYVCRMESFAECGGSFITEDIDAAIEFEPFTPTLLKMMRSHHPVNLLRKLKEKCSRLRLRRVNCEKYVGLRMKDPIRKSYKCYPCVFPSWDNTSRRKFGMTVFVKSSPLLFKKWLRHVLMTFRPYSKEENLVFINAWNEWAEGNHLEPDLKWGHAWLDAVKEAVENVKCEGE